MKIRITKKGGSHISNLITKLIYLSRNIGLSQGNVILVGGSTRVKFIVFVASLIASKTLFLVEDPKEVRKIKYSESIGTILYGGFQKYDLYLEGDLTAIILEEELFSSISDFSFLFIQSWSKYKYTSYHSLRTSSFKDENSRFYIYMENELFRLRSVFPILKFKKQTKQYSYNYKNVREMINAVNSEFKDDPESIVKFKETSFENSFIYMLYFFLRGDLMDIYNTDLIYKLYLNSEDKPKEIIFFDNDSFNTNYHKFLKPMIYKKINLYLNKWKITKWITKFIYDREIRGTLLNRNKYEIIIINKEKSLNKSQFLDHTRTNISVIHGTPADGHTLSINRYNDKELSIVSDTYRIMDSKNTIKLYVDELGYLYIGGSRINPNVAVNRAIQCKSKSEFYYLHENYYTLNEELLTLDAHLTDLYYDHDGRMTVDVGTRKRSLMALPYLEEVEVFKLLDKFVTVVNLDMNFTMNTFEKAALSVVLSHLHGKVKILNKELHESDKIHEVFVSKKFFDEFSRVEHTVTKENFIKLLNQQPSNYLKRFLKGEEYVIDEVV